MKMEVLAVQQQYQTQYGGLGSNKIRDWTSTLTPPLSVTVAAAAATTKNNFSTATATASETTTATATSPLTMTVKTSTAVAAALNANNNNTSNNNNNNNNNTATTPYHHPHLYHHHHHHHNLHHHHRQMATTNKMKNSIINKKSNRTSAAAAAATATAASGVSVNKTNINSTTNFNSSNTNNITTTTTNNTNNTNNSMTTTSNSNNFFYCDNDIDATAVDELSLRLLNELRAAKSRHLTCTEVSLPCDLTPSIAVEIIRVSEKEPCGIRGCTIYIEFEDEPNNSRRIASLKLDPETVSTFEVYLTLRQDHRGWTALLPQFMKNLARTITISPEFTITKHKLYSPQQRSSSSSYTATTATATAAISTPSS